MHKLLLLVLAALYHFPAFSQSLTLSAALERAFTSNPEIAVAAREVEAIDGVVRQAGIIPNPELVTLVEDRHTATRTTTIQINQPIELGGKRSARIDAAQRSRAAALAELAAKRAEVRAAVITAFYDVLTMQERHQLAFTSSELAQRATRAAAKRVQAGRISPVEETRARVAESAVRIELVQAAAELANARKRLAATWGDSLAQFERVDGQVDHLPPVPALNDLIARLPQSPGMQRARIEVERRQALAQVESARQIPDITVSLGTKRDAQLGRNQAMLGVSIPLPLFDRNQGNLQEALRRTDKARDELTVTEVRLSGELTQAHERLQALRQETELLQSEILPGAQSAYDAAAKGFEYGKFSFLEVLDAQRTLLQAKSQYLRALSETHRAAADIDRIVGINETLEK